MKFIIAIIASLLATGAASRPACAKEIAVSEKLTISPITEDVFVHRSGSDNGIVIFSNGEALIVSTPADDSETSALISWVEEKKGANLVGYVVDRWHPDAMGGLPAVHRAGVRSYAHNRTRMIAREKSLTVPNVGFDGQMEIDVGSKTILLDHLGENHTRDGIVVWVADDLVLFGGNGIRNNGGWFGNIGDANLGAWSRTIEAVNARYGVAKHVVPGHGAPGGTELLNYTINLYSPFSTVPQRAVAGEAGTCLTQTGIVVEEASSDEEHDGVRRLQTATLFVRDAYKALRIRSIDIEIDVLQNRIYSAIGTLQIFDIEGNLCRQRVSLSYSGLFVSHVDDAVGLAIVLKEATPLERFSN